jgi:hypothetical protein
MDPIPLLSLSSCVPSSSVWCSVQSRFPFTGIEEGDILVRCDESRSGKSEVTERLVALTMMVEVV